MEGVKTLELVGGEGLVCGVIVEISIAPPHHLEGEAKGISVVGY